MLIKGQEVSSPSRRKKCGKEKQLLLERCHRTGISSVSTAHQQQKSAR